MSPHLSAFAVAGFPPPPPAKEQQQCGSSKSTVPAPYFEPLPVLGGDEGSLLKPLSVSTLPRYKYLICL